MSRDEANRKRDDVLFLHSPTKSGDGYRVIRAREGKVDLGEVRSLKDGEPIRGELVKLTQRQEHERLFDVEVLEPKEEAPGENRDGPAQVSSDAYRHGWDQVFGHPRRKALLN
jgi:hypothetical protein